MKTYLILLIFFIELNVTAQKRVISVLLTDRHAGIRYDNNVGYVSFLKGSYKMPYIIEHYKVGIGAVKYFRAYDGNCQNYASVGLSAHKYTGDTRQMNKVSVFPVSIDLGFGAVMYRRYMLGFTADFIKREGCLNFGIRF